MAARWNQRRAGFSGRRAAHLKRRLSCRCGGCRRERCCALEKLGLSGDESAILAGVAKSELQIDKAAAVAVGHILAFVQEGAVQEIGLHIAPLNREMLAMIQKVVELQNRAAGEQLQMSVSQDEDLVNSASPSPPPREVGLPLSSPARSWPPCGPPCSWRWRLPKAASTRVRRGGRGRRDENVGDRRCYQPGLGNYAGDYPGHTRAKHWDEIVNSAIVSMDEMTQKSAALVEQASAATESLKDQSLRLREAMDFFTIGQGKRSKAPSPALASLSYARAYVCAVVDPGASRLASGPSRRILRPGSGTSAGRRRGR